MKIGKILRKIRLSDQTVVVIKTNSELSQHVDAIGEGINSMGLRNVLVVVADDIEDIRELPDREMRKLGWIKFPMRKPKDDVTVVTLDEETVEGEDDENTDVAPSE